MSIILLFLAHIQRTKREQCLYIWKGDEKTKIYCVINSGYKDSGKVAQLEIWRTPAYGICAQRLYYTTRIEELFSVEDIPLLRIANEKNENPSELVYDLNFTNKEQVYFKSVVWQYFNSSWIEVAEYLVANATMMHINQPRPRNIITFPNDPEKYVLLASGKLYNYKKKETGLKEFGEDALYDGIPLIWWFNNVLPNISSGQHISVQEPLQKLNKMLEGLNKKRVFVDMMSGMLESIEVRATRVLFYNGKEATLQDIQYFAENPNRIWVEKPPGLVRLNQSA